MTVNNVNALSPFGAVQAGQTAVKPEEAVQERFDKLMTKMGDQLAGMKQPQPVNVTPQAPKQETAKGKEETAQPKEAVSQEKTKTEETDGQKKPDDVKTSGEEAKDTVEQEGTETGKVETPDGETQETVEEAAKELVGEVADVMDIPLEKVEEAMEILGLTAVDLFDPENLKQLLLNLTENTDELALVTDETLYSNLREILGTVQETLGTLQEELGLNAEELKAVMEQIGEAQKQPVEVKQPTEEMPEVQKPEVSVEGMKDYAVSVQKESGIVQIKVTVDDESGEKHVSEQLTQTTKPETQPVLKKENMADTGHKGENQPGEQNNTPGAFLQHLAGQTGELRTEAEMPLEKPVYVQPETTQIMDQIVEYMKVNIKPETQVLEMQLHPASLGTVHVQLAAKDGAVTAQFTAQSETVKAVLETQMIQLKEQFEEQGIKVDAVEVTVANHAYGEQFGGEQEATDQENKGAKKNARRINLNLDELEEEGLEELDDSERIAVEMMQANGSTVDYTA